MGILKGPAADLEREEAERRPTRERRLARNHGPLARNHALTGLNLVWPLLCGAFYAGAGRLLVVLIGLDGDPAARWVLVALGIFGCLSGMAAVADETE